MAEFLFKTINSVFGGTRTEDALLTDCASDEEWSTVPMNEGFRRDGLETALFSSARLEMGLNVLDRPQEQLVWPGPKLTELVKARVLHGVQVIGNDEDADATIVRFSGVITELQDAMKSRFACSGDTDQLNWIGFVNLHNWPIRGWSDGTTTRNKEANSAIEPGEPCFEDGLRHIDMVLVYRDEQPKHGVKEALLKTKHQKKRDSYCDELQRNALQMEMEILKDDKKIPIHFIKLHATLDVLKKKAEEMLLRRPFAIEDNNSDNQAPPGYFPFGQYRMYPKNVKKIIIQRNQHYLLARFSKRHASKFFDNGECFDTIDRIRIVQRILNETRFSERRTDFGIQTLLYQKVFIDAYPVHDGSNEIREDKLPKNVRQRLGVGWATFRKIHKKQPIDLIKNYFGTAIGVYFAWLGFCVQMLLPVAVLGVLILAYGLASTSVGSYPILKDICNHSNDARFVMCPLCDKQCWYWHLSDICKTAKIDNCLDNNMTVLFAFLMSVWSSLLTELWKRRQAKLAFDWQTYDFERKDEPSRPEYIAMVSTVRRNVATGRLEQYIPLTTLCKKYAVVAIVVVFMVTVALGAVVGVVAYRGAVYTVLIASGRSRIHNDARIITDVSAGLLNLLAINMLSLVYRRIAKGLTDWENPRTQSQWESSFAYKMFAYQFVNVYSSVFYIAFFKSELFVGTPGHYVRFRGFNSDHGFRLEGCTPSGCLMELSIQLAVIVVGQQLVESIAELIKPLVTKWWNIRKKKSQFNTLLQWQQDYYLAPVNDTLFWEYLKIVLQVGFVMLFSVAFPLAPLFVFISALVEIRVDAIKFVFSQRRPSPCVAAGIGAWQFILEGLSELSVFVNALVIAFTSEFIPKLVYRLSYSPDGTLRGYVDNSLSFFNTSHFLEFERPDSSSNHGNVNYTPALCRYRGYQQLSANNAYSLQFWHVMAVRLMFVFIFHYSVCLLKKILEFVIPDEGEDVKLRRLKTIYMIKKLFRDTEKECTITDVVDAA